MALGLLERMTDPEPSSGAGGNDIGAGNAVWVYNAALLACAELSNDKGACLAMALKILEKMENNDGSDDENSGANASPDTVSYNTVQAEWKAEEEH